MNIFPDQKLSDTEMVIVAEALTIPAVQKYFHMLAYEIGRDIVTGQIAPGQSAEEYHRIEAGLKGQLAVLNTLLDVSK